MKHIIIIGAGASGLTAAIEASKKNKVTLIEKNSICGKKLLITGNGKCNYFNEDQNIDHYHSNTKEKIKEIITKENLKEVLDFIHSLGIISKIKNGYYYPYSEEASSMQKLLVEKAKENHVEIINNFEVSKIEKKEKYIINDTLKADAIVIANGSKASTKDWINLIKDLKMEEIKPALTPLIIKENFCKNWAGVRCDAILKLFINGKFIKEEKGNLQLTDYGISGICTFNLSHLIDLKQKNEIYINFMPFLKGDPKKIINKKGDIKNILNGFLNHKLVDVILKEAKNKNLIDLLTNFKITIVDTGDFKKAQTIKGGISLNEINTKTMETIKYKDLYIIGETLDIHGDCGGYNLTLAFITGILAGRSI